MQIIVVTAGTIKDPVLSGSRLENHLTFVQTNTVNIMVQKRRIPSDALILRIRRVPDV